MVFFRKLWYLQNDKLLLIRMIQSTEMLVYLNWYYAKELGPNTVCCSTSADSSRAACRIWAWDFSLPILPLPCFQGCHFTSFQDQQKLRAQFHKHLLERFKVCRWPFSINSYSNTMTLCSSVERVIKCSRHLFQKSNGKMSKEYSPD